MAPRPLQISTNYTFNDTGRKICVWICVFIYSPCPESACASACKYNSPQKKRRYSCGEVWGNEDVVEACRLKWALRAWWWLSNIIIHTAALLDSQDVLCVFFFFLHPVFALGRPANPRNKTHNPPLRSRAWTCLSISCPTPRGHPTHEAALCF